MVISVSLTVSQVTHIHDTDSPDIHQGHLWEAWWHTQTKVYLEIATNHMTLSWVIQHFGVTCILKLCSKFSMTMKYLVENPTLAKTF